MPPRLPFLLALFAAVSTALPSAGAPINYNRDIRPILSENCFSCHGFDEKARKGKLRLDLAAEAHADKAGSIALKPGDPANSEAWKRIIHSDPEELMPPPKSHLALTPPQKELLKRWIGEGATYAGHWSFTPPEKTPLPEGTADQPIDRFVQSRLAAESLKPNPPADRATLIRRLSLDLTGLPPSAAEVAAFIADPDPLAYQKLAGRLLASPHFGEAMALPWLDSARYADTNGFSIDGGRHLWLWRDWVIQAFNDNLPYDQFLTEQLAGDLLPNRTESQLIATGFQRNNMVTHEGGTIPAENLLNYNADRVKTLGESVLGLTLGCAQCHDHKFDPISQKDYFRLYAYFNTLSDQGLDGNAGVNPGPSIEARTVLRTKEEAPLRQEIAALKQSLATPDPALLATWEARERARESTRGRSLKTYPVKVIKVSTPNRGAGFGVEGTSRVRLRQAGDGAFDVSTEMPSTDQAITGLRVIIHPQAELPNGGWGSGPSDLLKQDPARKGTFRLTALAATADQVRGDQVNLFKLLPLAGVTASSWDPAWTADGCLDPRNDSGWSPDQASGGPAHLTATFTQPLRAETTRFLTVQLNFGQGKNLSPALIELQAITGIDDGTPLPAPVLAALNAPAAARPPEFLTTLWQHCAATTPELQPRRIALANLEERLAVLTQPFPTMVMNTAEKPRDTFVLNRGDYAQPTEKVTAGTLTSLPALPGGATADRLGLARWITMPGQPLTTRVAVNRFWKIFFGTGLVATAADFGSQGEWPSHPELLDWLAVDFREHGWDVKALVRQIVLSQTYQQSSAATPGQLERDPANRLLARGPRFRLPAESIRDSVLQISGLLVPRVGGPSVNPYTPGDLWREVSHYGSSPATAQTFVQDQGEKLYRRSLYTYWKRTVPPPNMAAFDAPNREVCTVDRATTTTPLQALVTLNDPQFVEAARALAERILTRPGDDSARLHWAFQETTSRLPERAEIKILFNTLARERTRYSANPSLALDFLATGASPRNPQLPPSEHAAWSQVAVLLLNLSETLTRN
ncbi:MAG: PSD1 and planctomycete cytochrome C domain-containing protein [Verrucomicrobiota bacterium]